MAKVKVNTWPTDRSIDTQRKTEKQTGKTTYNDHSMHKNNMIQKFICKWSPKVIICTSVHGKSR